MRPEEIEALIKEYCRVNYLPALTEEQKELVWNSFHFQVWLVNTRLESLQEQVIRSQPPPPKNSDGGFVVPSDGACGDVVQAGGLQGKVITVKRSLRERLFTRPWRPFQKTELRLIVGEEAIMKDVRIRMGSDERD